jgi:hypothetical protein
MDGRRLVAREWMGVRSLERGGRCVFSSPDELPEESSAGETCPSESLPRAASSSRICITSKHRLGYPTDKGPKRLWNKRDFPEQLRMAINPKRRKGARRLRCAEHANWAPFHAGRPPSHHRPAARTGLEHTKARAATPLSPCHSILS